MKKLGLIGGIGPESTMEYYRQITGGVQERIGNFPNLAVESLSVYDVLRFCREKDYAGLEEYLLEGLRHLAGAGAEFACLTGITPHIVYDALAGRSPIPVVSMVETACEYTREKGFCRVALLGTYPTMSGDFFPNAFSRYGVETVSPSEKEMRYIEEKIETELELGKIIPETRERFCSIVTRLAEEKQVQAVVLGCTELPMLLGADGILPVPVIDVMRVHIERLISMILEE